jgi:hypothetical protein
MPRFGGGGSIVKGRRHLPDVVGNLVLQRGNGGFYVPQVLDIASAGGLLGCLQSMQIEHVERLSAVLDAMHERSKVIEGETACLWHDVYDKLIRHPDYARFSVLRSDVFVLRKWIIGLRYELFCCAGWKFAECCNPTTIVFRRILNQDVYISSLPD